MLKIIKHDLKIPLFSNKSLFNTERKIFFCSNSNDSIPPIIKHE